MTSIPFSKYQGTGNDFVMIDQREHQYLALDDHEKIELLCDRKFGIGADGLILIQNKKGYDFEMIYYNADGYQSSMCGNGGRCITAFAKQLQFEGIDFSFLAIDGPHLSKINLDGTVSLQMQNVDNIIKGEDHYILDTGSPHYVIFVEDVSDINVKQIGESIRYSKPFAKEGINVNFVEKTDKGIIVATYERGVEDETLSCGTGVTACALAYALETNNLNLNKVDVQTKGGDLSVSFSANSNGGFDDIWLIGAAKKIFVGEFVMNS